MLTVEEGGEYEGERYIWCSHEDAPKRRVMFEGTSVDELLTFINEHAECP